MEQKKINEIKEYINTGDKEENDLVFFALVDHNEDFALKLLKNECFDKTHLNERKNKTIGRNDLFEVDSGKETLLATACYYGCPKVVEYLLSDKDFLKNVNVGLNPYLALIEPFYEIEEKFMHCINSNVYTGYYAGYYKEEEIDFIKKLVSTLDKRKKIFELLLNQEDINFDLLTFVLIHDISRKQFLEFKNKEWVPYPNNFFEIDSFVTEILKDVIWNRKKSDWMFCDKWGDYTLPMYMISAGSLDLFYEMMKREDFEINQTSEPCGYCYRTSLATHVFGYCLNNVKGKFTYYCTEILPSRLCLLYDIILDKRFSSFLTLDIINRLEYSNITNKKEIIKKILIMKEWSKEDIYDETALAMAFYYDLDGFTFLLTHPNIKIKTSTLEIISRYVGEYKNQLQYGDNYTVSFKTVNEIKKLAEEKLKERKRWNELDELAYDLYFFKTSGLWRLYGGFENKILSHFVEQDEVGQELSYKNFKLFISPSVTDRVPEVVINRLMFLINEKEEEPKNLAICYEKAKYLMSKYHYTNNLEFNNLVLEEEQEKKLECIVDKKQILHMVQKIYSKKR